MLRGIISGAFWGTLVSVIVLAGASLLSGGLTPSAAVAPSGETSVDVPAGSSFNREAPEGPAAVPQTDETVAALPTPQVAAPQVSEPSAPSLDTAPAVQPGTPSAPGAAPTAPQIPSADGSVEVTEEAGVLPTPQAVVPNAPSAENAPTQPQPPEAPAAPEAPVVEESDVAVPADDSGAEAAGAPEVTETDGAETAEAEEDTGPQVTTNRLPRIGDVSQEAPEEEVAPSLVPAIEAFATAFENTEAKPVMGIVLLDQSPRPSVDQLKFFPFPVSFAVDPLAPDAGEAMRYYRDAGFEVAMLISLPEGAVPQDLEVSFAAYKAAIPEAVAVMDAEGSALANNRELASQLAEILTETGHGLVTYSKGLNTARQVAEREGIPAKLVFRTIDANGETGTVMRRFLDQAAFRAGQEPGVILVAHAREETIATLVEWGVQGRATSVALAPLSAALKAQ